MITSLETIGDKSGDQPGAKRVLNNAFHETLLAIDEEYKTFKYSIDDGRKPSQKKMLVGILEKFVCTVLQMKIKH